MSKKYLIVIIGPTAIGKTALAIDVALHFDTEIISSDSRQFYREMNIGTAVPSIDELKAVQHHFIQHISIENDYSVGDFERDALNMITEFHKSKDILVMVGGSGLYEKSVTEGLDYFPQVKDEIRQQLNLQLQINGIQFLQDKLQQKDPEYFAVVDIHNPHRLIRALEIIQGTGEKFSSFLNKTDRPRNFEVIKVGLQTSRSSIYSAINQRVEKMIENGLIEEVKQLQNKRHFNALRTVGYRELFRYFDGEISLETAVSEIKKNTRRFAKRQLTWYRKDKEIHWFEPDRNQEVINFLAKKIRH